MKKKFLLLGSLAGSLCSLTMLCLASETNSTAKIQYTNDYSNGTSQYTLWNMNISIPSSWLYSENSEIGRHEFKAPESGLTDTSNLLFAQLGATGIEAYSQEEALSSIESIAFNGFDISESGITPYSLGDCEGYICDMLIAANGNDYKATCFTTLQDGQVYYVSFLSDADGLLDFDRDLTRTLDSISFIPSADDTSGYETGITYEQLARTPDDYKGKKVKFTGKVLQVMDGDSETQIRLAVDSNYDTVAYCGYDPSISSVRILEDDIVTIYGTSVGLFSYKSTLGGTITIPGIYVEVIELAQ